MLLANLLRDRYVYGLGHLLLFFNVCMRTIDSHLRHLLISRIYRKI